MGNKAYELQKQVDIFNQKWKDPSFQLTVKKLKKIQSQILKEYPFLKSIEESMLLTHALLEDCPIIYQNRLFSDMTGYQMQEILGKNCRFLQGAKTSKFIVAQMKECLVKGVPVSFTSAMKYKNMIKIFLFVSSTWSC